MKACILKSTEVCQRRGARRGGRQRKELIEAQLHPPGQARVLTQAVRAAQAGRVGRHILAASHGASNLAQAAQPPVATSHTPYEMLDRPWRWPSLLGGHTDCTQPDSQNVA